MVGASVQYTVNRETREIRLQSSSARTRNAVLHALDNIRIPGHLSKADLFSTFSEIFRIILPDTPSLIRRNSAGSQGNETEMDAIDSLCARLNDRQIIHRISDRQMMHNMSEITKNIALLDDPSGQFRTGQPRFYAVNCPKCHFVGESQLRGLDKLKLPVRYVSSIFPLSDVSRPLVLIARYSSFKRRLALACRTVIKILAFLECLPMKEAGSCLLP